MRGDPPSWHWLRPLMAWALALLILYACVRLKIGDY